jgi:hypothetical protein
MDENKPRRRWLSFGIRDLLWAIVVCGIGLGWWLDRSHLAGELHDLLHEWDRFLFKPEPDPWWHSLLRR